MALMVLMVLMVRMALMVLAVTACTLVGALQPLLHVVVLMGFHPPPSLPLFVLAQLKALFRTQCPLTAIAWW